MDRPRILFACPSDASFIRITRSGQPNLFIFKHDIKYLIEEGS